MEDNNRAVTWWVGIAVAIFLCLLIYDDVIKPMQRKSQEDRAPKSDGAKMLHEAVKEDRCRRQAEQDRLFEEARRGVPGARDAYEESIREDALGDR